MVCGISLLINNFDSIADIKSNPLLKFVSKKGRSIAKYKGLEIKVQEKSIRINGSLHRFKNKGEHNSDDFTYFDLENALKGLYNELGVNPDKAILQNVEIGVNIQLPYDPFRVIDGIVGYPWTKNLYKTNIGKEIGFQQYKIKIYSKNKQQNYFKDKNVLRYEVRFNKMKKLTHELGEVKYLSDLLKPEIWFQARRFLLEVWENIQIVNLHQIKSSNLDKETELTILRHLVYKDMERCSTKRSRMKKSFDGLLASSEIIDISKEIENLLSRKLNYLLDIPIINSYIQKIKSIQSNIELHINPLSEVNL